MPDNLVAVRVYYKNPLDRKSGTMRMRESLIVWYRDNKGFSPYKKIVRIK
jgi:hypothetical protein